MINQMEPWLGEEEQLAMNEYLKSGGWLTEFKKTKEFEKTIADYVGCKYVSIVPNGTVALALSLMAKGIGRGDEVIVPDYTMIASANAVILAGAKPILVDIDSKNLCLDYELTKEAINNKTKAIMLVTINGRYPEIKKFVNLSKNNNLFLLEDTAQSLGSRYNGKHLGTFGDAGILSFSVPKIITTGQGGAIITDNEDLYKKILKIKDFGRQQSGVDRHETVGYNFKFTDLQAVIGIEQMKKLEWRVNRKKEMHQLYKKLLSNVNGIEFIDTNIENTSPWFIDILVNENKRSSLIDFLKEKEIGTRPFYPAIHTQEPYSYIAKSFKISEEISKRGLWLPSSSFLKDEDIIKICDNIKDFYEHSN
ncbi:DegT/DnrJ/EryC1/StrS family aminotransferase [Patescibacteria group bacterium]|nr:DegT/DnrJ/EryC1/StrS family aminotransferase [Patescibacteria group bacterium]